jgi:hypothetical protein
MDLQRMALVGLEMVQRLACDAPVLEDVAAALLAPAAHGNEAA